MKVKNIALSSITHRLVYIGAGLGVLFWFIESAIHVFVFHDGSLTAQILTPAPHEIWMRFSVVGLLIIFGVYGQFIVKTRERAEESAKHAHGELNQLFNAAVSLCVISKDYNILRVNDTFCFSTRMKMDDIIGKKCYEVSECSLYHSPECPMKEILSGMEQSKHETEKTFGGHRRVSCVVTATPYRDLNGELIGIVENCADITERKKTEEALKESEGKLQAMLESIGDHMSMMDKELNVIWANETAKRIFGDDIVGRKCYEAYHRRHQPCEPSPCLTLRAFQDGKIHEHDVEVIDNHGETIYFHCTANVGLRDRKGNPTAVIEISRDITDRMRAEQALRLERDNFINILNSMQDGIYIVNEALAIEYVNPILDRQFGAFQGKKCYEYFNGRDEICPWCENQPVFSGKTVRWECYMPKNEKTYELIGTPLKKPDDTMSILTILRDITERKRSEEQIHGLTQQLMKTQENERYRIARDLHDKVAQDLSTVRIACKTLANNGETLSGEARRWVSELSEMLHTCITNVRDLAHDLRPVGLDQVGLVPTVFQYCKDFSDKNDIKVDFRSAGVDDLALGFDTEINLYRVIQEVLNNIKKHAHASQVTIRLVASFPNIILRIENDGKGFDVKDRLTSALQEKRMGLLNMEERVRLLQGKLKIESHATRGTRIRVEIPYGEKENGSEKEHIDC